MSAGFTPAPWRLADNDESIVVTEALDADGNCTVVADVLTSVGQATNADLANARLIASAPELYEALAKATGMLRDYIMAVGVLADDGWVLAECDAALAKARGQ